MSAKKVQTQINTRQKGPNPGKHKQISGGRQRTERKGGRGGRGLPGRVLGGRKVTAGLFQQPRSTLSLLPDSSSTNLEQSKGPDMTSCDSFEYIFSSSLNNPPAYTRHEILQSFTTQEIK